MSNDSQTKHITFGFVIAWIFAVLVGVPGIVMLFEHQVVSGILFILAALVALPPANAFVKDKTNISLSGGLRIAAILVLFIGAGVVASQGSTSNPIAAVSVPAASENTVAAPEQPAQQASQPAAQPAAAPQVLLSIKGSGTKTTETFTAAGAWDLSYNYDCSSLGLPQGNFQVYVYNSDGSMSYENAPVNELGASGSDTEYYHTGGSYYLEVNSECSWSVTVKG